MSFPIAWHDFSWEAFATLATGLAAVFAAWNIGRKQVAILDRQAAIQEQSLRSDLFDKRFDAYKSVRALLMHARKFNSPSPEDLGIAYFEAMHESRFLFNESVYCYLFYLRTKITEFDVTCMDLNDTIRSGTRADELILRESLVQHHKYFSDELASLPIIFHELAIQKRDR